MKTVRPIAALAAAALSAIGLALAQGPVLTNVAERDGILLSGTWTYSVDPYRDGLRGFHGGPAGEGYRRYDPRDPEQVTHERPQALFEVDMRREKEAALPGSWLTHAPQMRHYQGLVWYDRPFDFTLSRGERVFLHFGAANYKSYVYLNGEKVGEHEGGFTPFAFEVTDLIRRGENRVTVGVDSVRDEASVPPPVTDWETYGGITRDIRLVRVPETFIDEAWVRLSPDGRDVMATVRLDGPDAGGQRVTVRIASAGITVRGRTNADGVMEASAPAHNDLRRWSPQAPNLHTVEVDAGRDTLTERIGFRTISVEGEDILLNGEPIFLRGISMHEEELGPNPNRRMTEDAARELLTLIKEDMNGNFVRLAHYPHSEITTRLADEIGLLVWSEIPVYWLIDWENEDTLAAARAQLEANIRRDRNRASIALWSVGNETPISEARNAFMRQLTEDARALDDTRLVTAALLSGMTTQDGVRVSTIDDPLAEHLDVLAVNTYNGWYGGVPLEEVSEIEWRSPYGKPLIFSEFGAGALAGFDEEDITRKFSEEYQAEVYRETLEMAAGVPFLRGMTPWILKDFRSPRRQHPVYQQGWNRKGLISEAGEKKKAFGVLADRYEEIEAE